MSDSLSKSEKLKARLQKQTEREQQEATKRRQLEIRIKKETEVEATRQAFLLGETIRDAELSGAEKRVVGAILARRKSPPKDWGKIKAWLPEGATVPEEPGETKPGPVATAEVDQAAA